MCVCVCVCVCMGFVYLCEWYVYACVCTYVYTYNYKSMFMQCMYGTKSIKVYVQYRLNGDTGTVFYKRSVYFETYHFFQVRFAVKKDVLNCVNNHLKRSFTTYAYLELWCLAATRKKEFCFFGAWERKPLLYKSCLLRRFGC